MVATNRRAVSALRSLAVGLAGLALLVGVPLLLLTVIGNPLAGFPQTWGEAELLVDQRNVTADLLIGVLACVLWLLWLQFVWAVLWEIFVVGPRANRGEVAKDAPGVPRFIRSIVSTVVSGLLSASVVASASSAGTLLPDLVAKAPALALDHTALDDLIRTDTVATSAPNVTHYVIGDHDRVWDLAGRNDTMLQRILEMNADQVKSPIDFRPGMQIRVPASLALPEPSSSTVGETAVGPANEGVDPRGRELYEVIEGDNLWNISRDRLSVESGDDPSNSEIAARVADVVANNEAVIEDPDLIYPGEILSLPSANGVVTTSGVASSAAIAAPDSDDDEVWVDTAVDTDAVADAAVDADADAAVDADAAADAAAAGDDGAPEADEDGLTVIQSSPAPPATTGMMSTPDDGGDDRVQPRIQDGRPPSAPVGVELIGGGLALSASVLGLYAAARRRNEGGFTVEFSRRERALEQDLPVELQGVADPDFVDWAADRLAECRVESQGSVVTPDAALLGLGRGVEAWWSSPVSLSAPGWTMIHSDGHRWAASLGSGGEPTAAPADAVHSGEVGDAAPPSAWLTIGALAGDRSAPSFDENDAGPEADVMINLDRIGSIALSGPTNQVFATLRAMIFELGAGGRLADVAVTTVDFRAEGSSVLPRLSAAREVEALAQAGAPRPDGALQVFVVQATQARLDQWFELARPGSGVAIIVAGDVRSSRLGSRFVLNDDSTGVFQALDVSVRVVGLDGPEAIRIEDLILNADQPAPSDPQPSTDDRSVVGPPPGVGD